MSLGEKMKPVLETRLAVLKQEITEIDQTLREPDSQDFEERATENEGDEVLEDLGNAALVEIAQIESALDRINAGTYGECVTCGDDIPPRGSRQCPTRRSASSAHPEYGTLTARARPAQGMPSSLCVCSDSRHLGWARQ